MNNILKISFVLLLILSIKNTYAQTKPDGILFQAVARDGAGNAAASRTIYVKISILKSTATGENIYNETHQVLSNDEGIFTVIIGKGVRTSGVASLSNIDWRAAVYFFNVNMAIAPSIPTPGWDPNKEYVDLGSSQIWSVPYSFFSERAIIADSAETIKTLLPGSKGGTGVVNEGKTITLAKNFKLTGLGDLTLNTQGPTTLTLPLSGKFITDVSRDTLSNKTYLSPILIGSPKAVSPAITSSDSSIATTQYVTKLLGIDTSILNKKIDSITFATKTNIGEKLNISDTVAMLSNRFARDTVSLSNRIDSSLKIKDTATMLSNRFARDTVNLSKRIDKLNSSSGELASGKLNISDTSVMLSLRIERDTASLSRRINLKFDSAQFNPKLKTYLDSLKYLNYTKSDSLYVKGNTSIDSNLIVKGDLSVGGRLTLNSGLVFNDSLIVKRGARIDSSLLLKGKLYLNDSLLAKGNVKIDKSLLVNKNVNINDSLTVNSVTRLNDSLRVVGNALIDSNLTIKGKLSIDGGFNFRDSLTVARGARIDSSLLLKGKLFLGDSLLVRNSVKIDSNIYIKGNFRLGGDLILDSGLFRRNFVVNLGEGVKFGRYNYKDTIQAKGKSIDEVFYDILTDITHPVYTLPTLNIFYLPKIDSSTTFKELTYEIGSNIGTINFSSKYVQNDAGSIISQVYKKNGIDLGGSSDNIISLISILKYTSVINYNTGPTKFNRIGNLDTTGRILANALLSDTIILKPISKNYWGSSDSINIANAQFIGTDTTVNNSGLATSAAKGSFNITITSGEKYIYYAYPASYPDLTSIMVGPFESIDAFEKTQRNITNSQGYSQLYKIYVSINNFSDKVEKIVIN